MLVVERSSIGPDILFLIVPEGCLVVKLRFGISGSGSEIFALRRTVNALESDIFAECVVCSSVEVHQQDVQSDSIVWGCLSDGHG
jgi:hypothetical protein